MGDVNRCGEQKNGNSRKLPPAEIASSAHASPSHSENMGSIPPGSAKKINQLKALFPSSGR